MADAASTANGTMADGDDDDESIRQLLEERFPNGASKDELRDFLQELVRVPATV